MDRPDNALIELLDLEAIEVNLFRGQSRDIGGRSVYGGQVVAQGLVAATRTVDEGFIHSLHAYFLRPGDMRHPIVYEVDRVREGSSFKTRRVQAIQHGKAILTMIVSFHREEEGPEHQVPMPEVAPPEVLERGFQMRAKIMESAERLRDLPEALRSQVTHPLDLEFRVEPDEAVPDTRQYLWFRATKPVPDDPMMHQCMLAFASDFGLLATSLKMQGRDWLVEKETFLASLDHAVWFHRSVRVDDWLLYTMDSPSAYGARGFNRGLIYDRAGRLVASTAQEGLMRRSR